jgi:hypothetical protein
MRELTAILVVLGFVGFTLWAAAPTSLLLLALPLVAFVIGLWLWATRVSSASIKRMEPALQVAAHGLTAIGVFAVALLYLEEKQWGPRFEVNIATAVQRIPDAPVPAAVVQVAIAIKNEGRTPQRLNYIELGAAGVRGAPGLEPQYPQDLRATQIYRRQTSSWLEIAPGETEYQYAEVPVPCAWKLVRLTVKVPVPRVHKRKSGETIPVNERKTLVSLNEACANVAKLAPTNRPKATT